MNLVLHWACTIKYTNLVGNTLQSSSLCSCGTGSFCCSKLLWTPLLKYKDHYLIKLHNCMYVWYLINDHSAFCSFVIVNVHIYMHSFHYIHLNVFLINIKFYLQNN